MIKQNRVEKHTSAKDLRQMGSLERWFWLMGQHRPNHFAMTAEVHGTAKPEQWLQAAKQVQSRHPFLNASVRMDENGEAHYHRSLDASIPITFKTLAFPNQANEEVKRELSIPFDTTTAPLARLSILEGANRSVLVLTFHHSVADGMSSLYILRDLLRAVSGTPIPELEVPPSQDELIQALKLTPPANGGGSTPVTYTYRPLTGAGPYVSTAELTPSETSELLSRAREEQSTVHGAIIGAAVLAGRSISPVWKNAPVGVFSPVNLRKALSVGEDSVIALGVASSGYDPDLKGDVWHLARSTRSQLLPFQGKDGPAIVQTIFDHLTAGKAPVETVAASTLQLLGFELMVSNLQTLPFETQFGDLYLHRVWGPAVTFSLHGEQDLGVVTVNGALCLSYTSFAPLPGLLEKTVSILKEALAGGSR